MPYCLRCSTYVCHNSRGLISIDISVNSNVIYLSDDDDCISGGISDEYIPGPILGNVTFNAYAFSQGQDKWLGSNCRGNAQATQTNIIKYGTPTPGGVAKYYLIPSKNHKAQITGFIDSQYCSLDKKFFSGTIANSQVSNGISISTEMGTDVGSTLRYNGFPMSIVVPNLTAYKISGVVTPDVVAYISSLNISVDFPNPATISYTFDFLLPFNKC